MSDSALAKEWRLHQNQFDSYEKHSLLIKLIAITICAVAMITNNVSMTITVIMAILWLQDGIWKTFQSRIEQRLLKLENALNNESGTEKNESTFAYQFNQAFIQSKAGTVGTVGEYIKQALRPTVAYPYILLISLISICSLVLG